MNAGHVLWTEPVPVEAEPAVWEETLPAVWRAIAHQAKPPRWRESEYCMVKGDAYRAQQCLAAAHSTGATPAQPYHEWGCLLGEIGRYFHAIPEGHEDRVPLMLAFVTINDAIKRYEPIQAALAEARRIEQEQKRIERLEKRLARHKRTLAAMTTRIHQEKVDAGLHPGVES